MTVETILGTVGPSIEHIPLYLLNIMHVTIRSILEDHLIVELSDGRSLKWPKTADSHLDIQSLNEGDTLFLTLTTSHDIVNELLGNTSTTHEKH